MKILFYKTFNWKKRKLQSTQEQERRGKEGDHRSMTNAWALIEDMFLKLMKFLINERNKWISLIKI